jgi:hypothetical protein
MAVVALGRRSVAARRISAFGDNADAARAWDSRSLVIDTVEKVESSAGLQNCQNGIGIFIRLKLPR